VYVVWYAKGLIGLCWVAERFERGEACEGSVCGCEEAHTLHHLY
jgi:hypothetical protein